MIRATQVKEVPVNIVGGSKFGRYPKISLEETWNMYISDGWLISFPGYKKALQISDLTASNGRGLFVSTRNNVMIAVINSSVYEISTGLTARFIGVIGTSVGQVTMDENENNQVAIVDGINCYIYNIGLKSLTLQTLSPDLQPNYVVYHNTYFLFGNARAGAQGSKWFAYSYGTDTTITFTSELALQTKPDYALAVIRLPGSANNVMVFGETVAEIWTQVGGLQNYQRNSSLNIDYGCLSVATIAQSDRYVMWLAVNNTNEPVIMLFSGSQNVAVSTAGIASLLAKVNQPQSSCAYFIRKDGHLFYVISFYDSSDNFSLAYDVDEKTFSFLSDYKFNVFPPRQVVYFNTDLYFVSLANGALYTLDSDITTYNENIGTATDQPDRVIPRVRVASHLRFSSTSRFRARNFTIAMDQGNDQDFPLLSLENVTGIPYKPRVELSYSTDGGSSFSKPMSLQMHGLGRRENIVNFIGPFGYNNDLLFKVRFYTKSYVCVQNASVELSA